MEIIVDDELKVSGLLSISEIQKLLPEILYYIADYQRGYRWQKVHVLQLLNDLEENPAGKTYCLQPVMVTPDSVYNHKYEVIDGQQRITTIFIILKVLEKMGIGEVPFKIEYATRISCIDFLRNIKDHQFANNEEESYALWNSLNSDIKNVDNYNIFNAYQYAASWLNKKKKENESFLEDFHRKLLFDLKIIWYPVKVNETSNAKKLFRDLNSGKIRLTSADLIRALFVLKFQSDIGNTAQRHQKKTEFANQWNFIERHLNNDSLWFFITNGTEKNYLTRIGLLFDIITESKNAEMYASYLKYADKKTRLEWEKIVSLFQNISEWYENEKYYHRIGFLVNSGIKSFYDIATSYLRDYKDKPKSEFYKYLNDEVLCFINKSDLRKINYEDDRPKCKNILLLYNILLHEKDFPGQKFPFDRYVNESWSLEHIHPQNPQDFKSLKDLQFWLEDTLKILERKSEESNDKNEETVLNKESEENVLILIHRLLDNFHYTSYSDDLKEKIRKIRDDLEHETGIHKIGNLVLLDKITNSRIGNGVFRDKRDVVLKIKKQGFENSQSEKNIENYVPYGTTNCFLKRNTSKKFLQNEYWSEDDMEQYAANIKQILDECK